MLRPDRLSLLRSGQTGVVEKIHADSSLRCRLYDLGLTPGVTVEMVRSAPLGDPLQIRLRGYMLTMRKTEAACVLLRGGEIRNR